MRPRRESRRFASPTDHGHERPASQHCRAGAAARHHGLQHRRRSGFRRRHLGSARGQQPDRPQSPPPHRPRDGPGVGGQQRVARPEHRRLLDRIPTPVPVGVRQPVPALRARAPRPDPARRLLCFPAHRRGSAHASRGRPRLRHLVDPHPVLLRRLPRRDRVWPRRVGSSGSAQCRSDSGLYRSPPRHSAEPHSWSATLGELATPR